MDSDLFLIAQNPHGTGFDTVASEPLFLTKIMSSTNTNFYLRNPSNEMGATMRSNQLNDYHCSQSGDCTTTAAPREDEKDQGPRRM